MWEGGLRVPGFFHYGAGMDEEVKGTTTHDLMYVSDWFNTFLSIAGGKEAMKEGLDSLDQSGFLLHGEPSARTEFVYNLDNRFAQPYGQAGLRQGDYKLILGYPGDCDGGWGQHEYVITAAGDWYGLNGQEDHTDGVEYPLHQATYKDQGEHLLTDTNTDNPLSGRRKRMFVPPEIMDARNQYAVDIRNRAVLFNIKEDPSETNDIAGENPDIVQKMGDRLKELYDSMPTSPLLVPDHDAARNPDYNGVWMTGWCPQIHDE
jgi:arylsulfatase A-like enzyme